MAANSEMQNIKGNYRHANRKYSKTINFHDKKKRLTAALLKDGRVSMTGLYSKKTKKTYNATIILIITAKNNNLLSR